MPFRYADQNPVLEHFRKLITAAFQGGRVGENTVEPRNLSVVRPVVGKDFVFRATHCRVYVIPEHNRLS